MSTERQKRDLPKFWSRIAHFPVCTITEFPAIDPFFLISAAVSPWKFRAFPQYQLHLESLSGGYQLCKFHCLRAQTLFLDDFFKVTRYFNKN